MKPRLLSKTVSVHLDVIRGVAAVAVLGGHIRGLFFAEYNQLAAHPLWVTVMYGVTSLGHQAVMVFFVLSGFLVGGSVLKNLDNWSWRDYLINRLTRLYVVLLPA